MQAPDHDRPLRAAEAEAVRHGRIATAIAALRLIAFVAAALGVVGVVEGLGAAPFALLLAAGGAFLALALWDGAVRDRRVALARRIAYHRAGPERIAGGWRGADDGRAYCPPRHPYAADLDIVGPRGLFAMLDTAATAAGRRRLAALLLDDDAPVPATFIAEVRTLAERHDWRADLHAAGADPRLDDDAGLRALADTDLPPLPWPARAALLALRLAAPATVIAVGATAGIGAGFWTFLALALALAPLQQWALRTMLALPDPDRMQAAAGAAARCLAIIAAGGTAPEAAAGAEALRDLAAICGGRARHRNPLWRGGLGALLASGWTARQRLARWLERHRADLPRWLDRIAATDAAACLATWAAEQGGCWPTLAADGPVLAAEGLAHPLLPRAQRVANDVRIDAGQVLLLTGANASGKSTFLRTCALAAILARCGTTVPARSATLRPLRVATVMRVGDDLAGNVSRFQAEVAALKAAYDRTATPGPPVLVVLDEILAGTNSHERHLGSRAILLALRARAAATLVSTHDLGLCALADAAPERFILAHFADDDGDGDLRFDYVLRAGTVRTTNALAVMRAAGLPVDSAN